MALGMRKRTLVLAATAVGSFILVMSTGQTVVTCRLLPAHFPFSLSCGVFWPAYLISAMSTATLALEKFMPWAVSRLKGRRDDVRSRQDRDEP